MKWTDASKGIIFHLSRAADLSKGNQYGTMRSFRKLVLKRSLDTKASIWASTGGGKPNLYSGLKAYAPSMRLFSTSVTISFKVPKEETLTSAFGKTVPVAPSYYSISLSLDGTFFSRNASRLLQIRSGNSGLENLVPGMGTVEGGGEVNLYGTGLESADARVKLRWKVADDVFIYEDGVKRLEGGAPYISSIVPRIPHVTALMKGMASRICPNFNYNCKYRERALVWLSTLINSKAVCCEM